MTPRRYSAVARKPFQGNMLSRTDAPLWTYEEFGTPVGGGVVVARDVR
jgi:hypothetical protein